MQASQALFENRDLVTNPLRALGSMLRLSLVAWRSLPQKSISAHEFHPVEAALYFGRALSHRAVPVTRSNGRSGASHFSNTAGENGIALLIHVAAESVSTTSSARDLRDHGRDA